MCELTCIIHAVGKQIFQHRGAVWEKKVGGLDSGGILGYDKKMYTQYV